MRLDDFDTYIEDGDKYYSLIPLYNAWNKRTQFLSVGNTEVQEWYDLRDYCLANKLETAHFFLDLVECHKQLYRDHLYGSPFVGFFCGIIQDCFEDDEQFPKFSGFVGGNIVQQCYEHYIKWYLDGRPPKKDWFAKLKNTLKHNKNEKSI